MRTWPGSARSASAWAAIAAQVLFTVYWLIAALWQGPRYDPIAHSISDMYAVGAPGGAAMVVVLTVCGAATVAFVVVALLPVLRSFGRAGLVAGVLFAVSIFGLGDLLTPFERLACRLADPGCTPARQVANLGGTLDSTLSTIGFMLLIAAGFTLVGALPRTSRLRVPVLAVSVCLSVLFVLEALGVLPGLVERALALLGAGLLTMTAVIVLDRGRAAAEPGGAVPLPSS